MNKFIIAIVLCLFATLASAASDPVRIKYNGSRGWDVSSPMYRSTSSQAKSKVRYYENLPKKQVRQSFRELDKKLNSNINRSLKKMFR
jgi:hypothetical protein